MFKKTAAKLLEWAGIIVNGGKPWDIQIHSDEVFSQALLRGNLGLGETYMRGLWDCEDLSEFFYRLITSGLDKRKSLSGALIFIKFLLINGQKISRAFEVGRRHYDIGNDLYRSMLDGQMQYSCGYFKNETDTLELAQLQKLDLLCRKLRLRPDESVLDIGCGWGGFAQYAALKCGTRVTGITVSEEQAKLARELCSGLPVEILVQDYRLFSGEFDKVVSVGMFEHVGPKNYRVYMKMVNRCLKNDGIFLLHTIGGLGDAISTDPFIERYIFPNGVIPSEKQIMNAASGIFIARDIHEFGACYDRTLGAWWQNFNDAWPKLKKNPKYDERFYRLWQYYLLSCAGAFRAEKLKLWQIIFTKRKAGDISYAKIR